MKAKRDIKTELCQAVRAADPDKVEQLLAEGAEVNAVGDTVVKATPLWMAVGSAGQEISENWVHFTEMVSDLVPSIPKRDRATKRERQLRIINMLVNAKADLGRLCHDSAPLRQAVYWRDAEVVHLLLSNGANPNTETFSPLSKLAKKEGRKTISGYYDTVLHEAVLRDSQQIVELLLAAGANPRRTDHEGNTPGEIARKKELWGIVELLEQAEFGGNMRGNTTGKIR